MIRIEQVKSLDQPVFEAITRIWLETGISNPARADGLESINYNLEHGGIMLLAWEEEQLAGTAWLSHDFRRLYIHHMAVSKAFQNRGIGRSLLNEALTVARAKGYQAKLEVHRDNAVARHLYASCGFTDLDGYITMIRRG